MLSLSTCFRRRFGTEAGSYLRLIDSCITQLKAQRPSRSCNESTEEEEEALLLEFLGAEGVADALIVHLLSG